MYFLETLQVRAPCHGGVLYSFWYWWNVVWILYEFFKYWKKILKLFFFQYFIFSSCFMLFPTLKKNSGGGGGGVLIFFFLEKQLFLISRFMLFSTLNKNIETPRLSVRPSVCPSVRLSVRPSVRLSVRPSVRPSRLVYWLNGRWFLKIVDRDSWNLYPLYPLFPCSDFVSQMWGGECNVFLTFYAISNISGNTKQLFLI